MECRAGDKFPLSDRPSTAKRGGHGPVATVVLVVTIGAVAVDEVSHPDGCARQLEGEVGAIKDRTGEPRGAKG